MTEQGQKKSPRAWRYPPRDEHPDDLIFIYDKWCKNCGLCYGLCPKGVLAADKSGHPIVANPDACIACYLCEMLCPDMAITVYKEPAGKKGAADDSGGAPGAGRGGE